MEQRNDLEKTEEEPISSEEFMIDSATCIIIFEN